MARFNYRMQSVLNIKEKIELQEKNLFAILNLKCQEEEEKLNGYKMRLLELEEMGRELLLASPLSITEIEENKKLVSFMNERIRAQSIQYKMAQKRLDDQNEKMIQAMQERKTHEILRQKAFDVFLAEEKKAESKQIDGSSSDVDSSTFVMVAFSMRPNKPAYLICFGFSLVPILMFWIFLPFPSK